LHKYGGIRQTSQNKLEMPCSLDTESNSFIGGKYYVLRVDDTWQPAEVIIIILLLIDFNFHFDF